MKNYIITGGHSGIGLALSKKLLSEGHRIGIIVRSNSRKKQAEQLFLDSNQVEIFVADLSKREEVESVVMQIKFSFEKLDGIFNNAALFLEEMAYADNGNELQLEVNAISPYLLTKVLKPLLDKSENPFVISTAAPSLDKKKSIDIDDLKKPKKFVKFSGSYLSSKFLLVLLMNFLSKKWQNVRFVSVHPGAVKTKMSDDMPIYMIPIKRLFFLSPERAAQNLYDAAFTEKYTGSGIYVGGLINTGKVKVMQYEISEEEINQLLA